MGPPREHGGRNEGRKFVGVELKLQWGRRVNTAEGKFLQKVFSVEQMLQWGRRVNTAEGFSRHSCVVSPSCFNGAAA